MIPVSPLAEAKMERTPFTGTMKANDSLVENLKSGQRVFERFVLADLPLVKQTKKKQPFLILQMGDATGTTRVFVWGVPQDRVEKQKIDFEVGGVYVISGTVKEYNGELKIDIDWPEFVNHFRLCDVDEYERSQFTMVKSSERNITEMFNDIKVFVAEVENVTYKNICTLFFNDPEWVKSFCAGVAAKKRHHNWIGGMVEHVWSMLQIMDRVLMVHPKLNRELMITAIVFHDLSKLDDYQYDLTIRMTDHQEVLQAGHMATAQMEIERRLFSSGNEYDLDDLRRLLHLIHSHHGPTNLGWGSSVSPMIPEAWAMHFIDNLDAKVTEAYSYRPD